MAWNLSPSLLTKAPLALSAFVCAQLLWFGNQEYRTGCYKKVERWKPSVSGSFVGQGGPGSVYLEQEQERGGFFGSQIPVGFILDSLNCLA